MLALLLVAAVSMNSAGEKAGQAPSQDKFDKVVCKSFKRTESRLGAERICRTRAEWNKEQGKSASELEALVRERTFNINPESTPE